MSGKKLMPKPKTFNAGAAEERSKILRKIRGIHGYSPSLLELEAWIVARTKRDNARKGGLGRR